MVLFIPSFLARASDMRNRYSSLSPYYNPATEGKFRGSVDHQCSLVETVFV